MTVMLLPELLYHLGRVMLVLFASVIIWMGAGRGKASGVDISETLYYSVPLA